MQALTTSSTSGEKKLFIAVILNVGLTIAQLIGGIFSGSLSLIADALHNFGDAGALLVGLIAMRIAKRPPDKRRNFGYKRIETVAALINLTILGVVGIYLLFEAMERFLLPEPILGWTMIWVSIVALIVDTFTAFLIYSESKNSWNMRAVFLHNLTDALASVGVMITGILIIVFNWIWVDAAMTVIIAGYILYQAYLNMPKVINLLIEGVPEGIDRDEVIADMNAIEGASDAHYVHIWQLDEKRYALDAHIVLESLDQMEDVKRKMKIMLLEKYGIRRSTLEFEWGEEGQSEWH
ncbi:MAG: cation diffusion facilitator family transporter [Pseudomonadota bacterium]